MELKMKEKTSVSGSALKKKDRVKGLNLVLKLLVN
jgi:hypothetical protein